MNNTNYNCNRKTELKLLINSNIIELTWGKDRDDNKDKVKLVEEDFSASGNNVYSLPFFSSKVSAGAPTFGDSFIDELIDLNGYLVKNPPATYFMRTVSDAMINIGIFIGDLVVVDRSITPENGKVVVATYGGGLIIRRYYNDNGIILLLPENDNYTSINVTTTPGIVIWGVATAVIHKF
ncbi:LexA family protein [Candidatus Jidaibacter acanthamoebae]|nr:S24 family peptidase [Candidatus Jidaibacter acanthamoeba]